MAATIKDIAKIVGTSQKTVSKAINNKPGVNKKTRELILKTAKELNYTPNIIARSLVKRKTNTLGVMINDLMDTFYLEIVSGIEAVCSKNNYNILLSNSNNNSDRELQSIKVLFERRVDGLLISPTQKDNRYKDILKACDIPVVFLNRRDIWQNCNYVVNDYYIGSYLAVNHLIKKGYREIYFIYSNPYSSPNKDRIKGIKKALKDNDISLDKIKMIHCWRDVDLYYGATQKEIDYKGEKIGIHVWDDQMALGVCRAIMDKGLKIPDEVGIVGYDDIPTSKHLLIPLTTIMNPAYEIGAKASEILIDKIEKKTPLEEAKQIILKPELKIRGTA